MATTADSTGDERENRTAELKRKMQEAAARTRAAQAAQEDAAPAPPVATSPAETASPPAPAAEVVAEAAPVATAVEETVTPAAPPSTGTHASATNGASAAATVPVIARPAAPAPVVAENEADTAAAQMTRRELLTYAWGATMALLTAEAGLASFQFLYPRFRAGEFGGNFFMKPGDFGDANTPPRPEVAGKFWMVTTPEGEKKALYMVCVHLGCLYKWVGSNNRFECPCHGSKYTREGWYIEGPAARSLDEFVLSEAGGEVVVNTGKKVIGSPAAESPFRANKA